MAIISKQYLESGTYEIVLEGATSIDLTSYIYTRFGTFKIKPVTTNVETFSTLEKYVVYIEDGVIGEVWVSQTSTSDYAIALASAIDIVTAKINELIDKEERAVLSNVVSEIIDAINLTEEQKAMYRAFLIENGKLDDVIDEMANPTDILGDNV